MEKLLGIQLNGKGEQMFAYGLAGVMMFMSFLDMALDWANYQDLASSRYEEGLILGSPSSST